MAIETYLANNSNPALSPHCNALCTPGQSMICRSGAAARRRRAICLSALRNKHGNGKRYTSTTTDAAANNSSGHESSKFENTQHERLLLRRLAETYGIELSPGLTVTETSSRGMGFALACTNSSSSSATAPTAAPSTSKQQRRSLIRVPLDLVLSAAIPGCSPAARAAPELQGLLTDPSTSWELQLAGLLLWASQDSAQGQQPTPPAPPALPPAAAAEASRERRFWREYAQIIPPAHRQSSLLLWDDDELSELQDGALAAAACKWQQQVTAAHVRHFGSSAAASSTISERAAGEWRPSLQQWRWAVASVESRAFGVKVEGVELQAAVPYLDIANHQAKAPTTHGIVYNSSSGSGGASAASSSSGFFELSSDAAYAPGQEVLISYGEKDNRQLMEQYGFVLAGNPFDRLDLHGVQLPHGGGRMRRDLVAHAAAAMAAAAAGEGEAADAAWRRRARAAAASLVACMGWRDLQELRKSVTPLTTAACAAAAAVYLSQQLASLPTTVDDDREALRRLRSDNDGDPGGGLSGKRLRRAAALQHRIERKELMLTGRALCRRLSQVGG